MIIGMLSHDWAKRAGLPFWYEPETSSTSDVAKEQALLEKETMRLYFTDLQTAGRGRGTNTWSSTSEGTGLLSSWSFQTRSTPQPVLAPMMGLAVFRALVASFPGLPFSLKAPNDIFLGEGKVAGLLLENISLGEKNRLIVGLGINVFEAPDLKTATCLSEWTSAEINAQEWAQCLDRILLEMTMALTGTGSTLTPGAQSALLYALNLNSLLAKKYTQVSAYGDLESGTEITKWSDL
jgi:BirA family biotin operon repressor/biotin-[acetyl-CoA-carboxylase] ligase